MRMSCPFGAIAILECEMRNDSPPAFTPQMPSRRDFRIVRSTHPSGFGAKFLAHFTSPIPSEIVTFRLTVYVTLWFHRDPLGQIPIFKIEV